MNIVLTLFIFMFYSLFAKANPHSIFASTCPKIDKTSLAKEKITNSKSGTQLEVYWNTSNSQKPYALIAPTAFQIAILQVAESLQKVSLSKFVPNTIEFYVLGETLPGAFASYTAILCKSMQSENIMRLVVNEGFLSKARNFKRILAHELFHYISHQLQKSYPSWLEEGLALNFESLIAGEEDLSRARFHLEQSPWMPLEPSTPPANQEQTTSFYGQAQLFVKYILNRSDIDILKNILENSSSVPSQLFPKLKEFYRDFSLAKYINQINYLGASFEDREKYILLDGVNTNRKLAPAIAGAMYATTAPGISGETYWLIIDDEIKISRSPLKNSLRITIKY